jgi:hypothetical protein
VESDPQQLEALAREIVGLGLIHPDLADILLSHYVHRNDPFDVFGRTMLATKRIHRIHGIAYMPIPLAAWFAQVSESTVGRWVSDQVEFGGNTIQTYTSVSGELYISEESVRRMAERFIMWPSKTAAHEVILGECHDGGGYLALPACAELLGVSRATLFLWAKQGETPWGQQLTVVKCPISDHFYIRETDLDKLRSVIQAGLKRGRKPRAISHGPPTGPV